MKRHRDAEGYRVLQAAGLAGMAGGVGAHAASDSVSLLFLNSRSMTWLSAGARFAGKVQRESVIRHFRLGGLMSRISVAEVFSS